MAKDEDRKALGKELTTTGTRSSVTATLAALAGQPPEIIVATALAQFVPFVAGLVFGVAWNAKKGEAERWWAELLRRVADDEGVGVEEVEERIRSRAEEPYVRESIFRSLRALLDAVDPGATLPLARLVAQYHRDKAMPDVFFRGAARLFAELSGREIADLRHTLQWMLESSEAPKATLIAFDRDASQEGDAESWPVVAWRILLLHKSQSLREPDGVLEGVSDPERLLLLLENFGLGTQARIGFWGAESAKPAVGGRLPATMRMSALVLTLITSARHDHVPYAARRFFRTTRRRDASSEVKEGVRARGGRFSCPPPGGGTSLSMLDLIHVGV